MHGHVTGSRRGGGYLFVCIDVSMHVRMYVLNGCGFLFVYVRIVLM
jgi:hypothetical protein